MSDDKQWGDPHGVIEDLELARLCRRCHVTGPHSPSASICCDCRNRAHLLAAHPRGAR